jgi:Putative esterase
MAAPHGVVHQVGGLPRSVTGEVARAGWLEDWRLAAALLCLAAAIGAGWVGFALWSRRTGRRPRYAALRRVGLSALVATMTLAGVGAAVNSYAGYAPDLSTLARSVPSLVGMRDHGPTSVNASALGSGGRYPARLFSIELADRADRIPAGRTWVYLPAGYSDPAERARRYPVAYLLHGYPGGSYDWFGAGRLARAYAALRQAGLVEAMILVSPDVSGGTLRDTECLDSIAGGPRIETFLTRTVVSTVDRRYRTLADRGHRILGGMSAGGFCALNVGLRHQSEFGVLLGLLPSGDPGANADRLMLHDDGRLVRLNSPDRYIPTVPLRYRQYVFLSAPLDDRESAPTTRILARQLAARGVFVAEWMDPHGLGHTWHEARREVPYALMFASAHLHPSASGPPIPPLDQGRV